MAAETDRLALLKLSMRLADLLDEIRLDEWVQEHRPEWCERIDAFGAEQDVAAPIDPRCAFTWPLPTWMGVDQADPCRCDLPNGHDGKHECEHTRASRPGRVTWSGG